MIRKGILNITAIVAGAACVSVAQAASTDPVSNFGLSASHNQYKLEVDGGNEKKRLNKGGAFYNFGNKLTGTEGFVYQAGVDAQYGKRGHTKVKSARIEFDIGARAALSQEDYVDFLVGAGYDWDNVRYGNVRVDGNQERFKLDSKTPLAKVAVGYNYLSSEMTTRFEVGARYSIDGHTKLRVDGEGAKLDMRDKFNPYAELTFVFNKGLHDMPVTAGLYYEQTNNKLRESVGRTNLKQEEMGLRLGLQL